MALTPASPGEGLWIGPAGGQNHFNVGIGQGTTNTPNDHTDFTQQQIVDGYADPAKFFLNASGNPVFRINASAGTTSTNTVHPRSELRELLADGTTAAAWDGRSGWHKLSGRSRIIAFTTHRPWICFFQAHGSSGSPNTSDLFRVQTEGTNGTTTGLSLICRRTPPGSATEIRTVLRTGYNLNDWVSWETWIGGPTSADNGRLRIWLDGVLLLDVTGMGQILCYWKTGCYLQDSVGEGAGSSDWGAVEVQRGSLQAWHTGYPNPTTPIFTGPDDGLGGAVDTLAPTIPANVAVIRGDTAATVTWEASTDDVGVASYVVRRGTAAGSTTVAQLGKVTNGTGSSLSSANKTIVSKSTAATTGTCIAGHARLWVDTGTAANVKMVVYADSAGLPGALLGLSDAITLTNTTEALQDFVFSAGQQASIVTGTDFWRGFTWPDPGTNSVNWSRDATASQAQQNTTNPAANPFGTPGTALSGPIDAYIDVQTVVSGPASVGTPTGTTFADTGLTNGTAYTYTVSAKDAAANESAQSDPVTVTPGPPDVTAPSVPTGLAVVAGDRKATLTWAASTDADSGVRNYKVYRDGTLVSSPVAASRVDIELTNGQTYSYQVSAVDNSLNESAQCSAVTATPHAPAIGGVPFLEHELGRGAAIGVEVAFGADLTADPTTWTWTDVTTDVRQSPGISTSLGRNDESSTSNPADLTITLTNTSGDYSLGGRSRWWPYVRRNTPVRARIDPADGGGGRVVFFGGANGWTPGWDSLTGRIPVVTLSASGTLRRLAQGNAPIQSAVRRSAASLASVLAYWPMEEGQNSTYAPALRGGGNMTIEGTPDWASNSDFYCSSPLPALKDGRLTAFPAPYADTGKTQVRFLLLLPQDIASVPTGAYILSVFTTGTIARWDVIYQGTAIDVRRYLADGTLQGSQNAAFSINGHPGRMSLELTQNGGNIDWRLGFIAAVRGAAVGYFGNTVTGQTAGTVSWVQFGATRDLGATVIGHLTVENALTSLFTATDALIAFDGEYATSGTVGASRLERLAAENSVALTRYTSPQAQAGDALTGFDTMGPQLVGPLLDLLHEAEDADQGQLWDGHTHGLAYTTRRRRETGAVALTVDAAAGELASGFAPADDDQRTRNKIEVKRTFGITAGAEDVTGPSGTGVIGIYDESKTVNLGRDQDVIPHAQWRVSLGTTQGGYRYPSVAVDLRVSPRLAARVLDLIPGERIDVVNLDDTLAQFTAPSVSLVVEGITHEITPTSWRATFRCSLFEPWAVGHVAAETGDTSDMVMRLDTDGATLAARVEAGATSLSVSTTGTGALWTTAADDYPLMVQVGGLPIRATACSGSSSPQAMTVDPLPVGRATGSPVALWEPRRVGMG